VAAIRDVTFLSLAIVDSTHLLTFDFDARCVERGDSGVANSGWVV